MINISGRHGTGSTPVQLPASEWRLREGDDEAISKLASYVEDHEVVSHPDLVARLLWNRLLPGPRRPPSFPVHIGKGRQAAGALPRRMLAGIRVAVA